MNQEQNDDFMARLLASDSEAERQTLADGEGFDINDLDIEGIDFAELDSLLKDESTWIEPSADLEGRVMATIAAEASTTAQPSVERQVVDAPQTTSNVVDLAAARSSSKRRSKWVPFIAGAAVSALFVGGGTVTQAAFNKPKFDTSFDLSPTDLLPGATGVVKTRRNDTGTRIEINVSGLPLPPDGGYYQAWVKGPKGLVAIGTFSKEGKVVLWSGVPLSEYNTITITVEPDDGDPASSGKRVFTAEIPAT